MERILWNFFKERNNLNYELCEICRRPTRNVVIIQILAAPTFLMKGECAAAPLPCRGGAGVGSVILRKQGVSVLHFSNQQIFSCLQEAVAEILRVVNGDSGPTPNPSPTREGSGCAQKEGGGLRLKGAAALNNYTDFSTA